LVAGLGIAPSLRDYEPRVQLYTTPHNSLILAKKPFFNKKQKGGKKQKIYSVNF